MSAYTDAARIAAHLGTTLTSAQQTQAGILADAATARVDRYCGQSWQATSPATETHTVLGDRVYLDARPVLAITSVETRADAIGAAYTTLATGQYELLDAENGILQLAGWGDYIARVVFTHDATSPPADVALATTMIAASWLSQPLMPGTSGVESIAVGQGDLILKFGATRGEIPSAALEILDAVRRFVVA